MGSFGSLIILLLVFGSIWGAFLYATVSLAKKQGRNVKIWVIIGAFLPLLSLIILAIFPPSKYAPPY